MIKNGGRSLDMGSAKTKSRHWGGGSYKVPGRRFCFATCSIVSSILAFFCISSLSSNIIFSPTSVSASPLGITANVNEIISLSVSSNLISFDLTPTPSGAFSTGSANVLVSTSNKTGYTLYITSSGQDKSGNYTNGLIHANNKSGSTSSPVDSTNIINTLSSAVVVPFTTTKDSESSPATVSYNDSAFPTNSWGYNTIDLGNSESPKVDPTTTPGNYNATFSPIPEHSVTNTTIKATEAPGQSDTTKLITGSKVDTSILSGAYSNTITLTAVANPVPYTYTISYNANGGTNPPEDTTMVRIDEYTATLTITEDQPEREGYVFAGWARTNNASSPEYCNPAIQGVCTNTITLDYDRPTLTLFTLWQKNYSYELHYAAGTEDTVTGLPQTQTATSTGNGVFTIPATVPERAGYDFTGYSDGTSTYQPGDTYTIASSDTSTSPITKTLTAQWEAAVPQFFTITKMQQMTRSICQDSEVPTPARNATTALTRSAWESGTRTGIPTTTLLDDRGNPKKSYTVKKLADGQCWMTENLALPGGTVLSADDSDIDGTVVSSYTVPTSLGTSKFSNSPANDVAQMTDYYVDTTDNPRGYKTGGYYSWRAATAGTGRGSGTDGEAANDIFGANMNTEGSNTAVSICPKGWRLPTGGDGNGTSAATSPGSTVGLTNGDFARLYQAYGGTGTSSTGTTTYSQMIGTSYGPQLALGGFVRTSGRVDQGASGHYWSSTVYSYQYAYRLYLDVTRYINSQSSYYKYIGISVRCIAR